MADWTCTTPGRVWSLKTGTVTLYLHAQEHEAHLWLLVCRELGMEREVLAASGLKTAQTLAVDLARGRAIRIAEVLEEVSDGR